ncbi:hypothetical protein ACVWW2_004730 [Bradyrhizobium sp. LM4.3]
MVPNGVGMAWPPANRRPSGAVWQAVQSPARARYSPRAMTSLLLSCACATVVSTARASSVVHDFEPIIRLVSWAGYRSRTASA